MELSKDDSDDENCVVVPPVLPFSVSVRAKAPSKPSPLSQITVVVPSVSSNSGVTKASAKKTSPSSKPPTGETPEEKKRTNGSAKLDEFEDILLETCAENLEMESYMTGYSFVPFDAEKLKELFIKHRKSKIVPRLPKHTDIHKHFRVIRHDETGAVFYFVNLSKFIKEAGGNSAKVRWGQIFDDILKDAGVLVSQTLRGVKASACEGSPALSMFRDIFKRNIETMTCFDSKYLSLSNAFWGHFYVVVRSVDPKNPYFLECVLKGNFESDPFELRKGHKDSIV